MPILFQLRRSAVLATAPFVAVMAYLNTRPAVPFVEHYWIAVSAQASAAVLVCAPLCAAASAWEAWRFTSANVHQWTSVRGQIQRLLNWVIAPSLAVLLLGFMVNLLALRSAISGTPGFVDPRFVVVTALVTVAFSLLGYTVGTVLRPVLSVPLLVVGVALLLLYPRAFTPFWMRHLTGNYYESCCPTDQTIDPRALVGASLVAGSILLVSAIALRSDRPKRAKVFFVVIVLLLGAASSYFTVKNLGPDPTKPRSDGAACIDGNLPVCGWPEHRATLAEVSAPLVEATPKLTAAGLGKPIRLTEVTTEQSGDVWGIFLAPRATPADAVLSLARGLLPTAIPTCAERGPWPGAEVGPVLQAWLAYRAGLSRADIENRLGRQVSMAAWAVTTHPAPEQLKWYQRNLLTLHTCTIRPVGIG